MTDKDEHQFKLIVDGHYAPRLRWLYGLVMILAVLAMVLANLQQAGSIGALVIVLIIASRRFHSR